MSILNLLSSSSYFLFNKNLAKNLSTDCAILIGLLCSKYQYYLELNQLVTINDKLFFYCTREFIYNETGLTESVQRKATKILIEKNILNVEKVGIPSKNYYNINEAELLKYIDISSPLKNEELELKNNENKSLENNSQIINNINKNKDIINNINIINNEKNLEKESSITDIIDKNIKENKKAKTAKEKQQNYLEIINMIDNFSSDEKVIEKLKEYYNLRKIKTRGGISSAQFRIILDDLDTYSLGDTNVMLKEIENAIIGNQNGCYMTIIPDWNKGKTYKQDSRYNFSGIARTSYSSRPNFDNTANHNVPKGVASMNKEELEEFDKTLARDEFGNKIKF